MSKNARPTSSEKKQQKSKEKFEKYTNLFWGWEFIIGHNNWVIIKIKDNYYELVHLCNLNNKRAFYIVCKHRPPKRLLSMFNLLK